MNSLKCPARFVVSLWLVGCALLAACEGADWRQFRGNEADGTATDNAPRTLEKTAWTSSLPGRGISGPIVVGDRVYVTACSGYEQDRLHVLAFAVADGALLWERQFWATGRTQCHPKMSVASSTPASDGQRVIALYSTNDLACLDRDGKLLWFRGLTYEYPKATNSLGMASSPVIVGDTAVVQIESDDDSFAMGIDMRTGASRWKLDRPHNANWTSPVILNGDNPEAALVVLQSAKGLAAVRAHSGQITWNYQDGASIIPSSAAGDHRLFVPSHGLTALDVATGNPPPQLWRKTEISPSTPSPLFYKGKIYNVVGGPILAAVDAKSGDISWRLRLKGTFYASLVAASGRLYLFNDEGLGQVVSLEGTKGRLANEHHFKESILGTPAIANGALYVRSDLHLWKIED